MGRHAISRAALCLLLAAGCGDDPPPPGLPECTGGLTSCFGSCRDLNADPAHCGACGRTCETSEICSGGACAQSCGDATPTRCGDACVDTETDPGNCGRCGVACEAGEDCIDGGCNLPCRPGLSDCGGRCRDLAVDRDHCGDCGRACEAEEICSTGTCTRSCGGATPTLCGDVCVDTQTDPRSCGRCGVACAAGEVCSAGACASSGTTAARPYGPKAPWNIPVAGIPIHPESSKYASLLWNDNPAHNFEVNVRKYTYPVYDITGATEVYSIVDKNQWGNLGGKTVPYHPSWLPNAGTDSQLILLDPKTGREWNLWEVTVDVSAKRLTIGNGNLCPGDYRTNNWDDPKTMCTGSRGVGINYLAMLVRPWEIAQGKIEHALSMPIQGTSGTFYVPPATKLEHPGKVGDIPEGMRFALDVTDQETDAHLDSIPSLRPKLKQAMRVILIALKEYGWFITDTSGGAALQLEAPESAQNEWEQLDVLPQQSIGGGQFPRNLLHGFMTEERIRAYVPSDQYP